MRAKSFAGARVQQAAAPRALLPTTLAAVLCGFSFAVSAQDTPSTAPRTWQDVYLTKHDYPTNFDVVGAFLIRTNVVSYKVLEVENWGVKDYGCHIAVVGSRGDPPIIGRDYFFSGMKGYSNGGSNRIYELNRYFVINYGNFSYPTVSGGSRTIPEWRYATDEETATINKRVEDLKKKKFNSMHHIYYINETQAAYDVLNHIEVPAGWRCYVTNATSTNFFDLKTYGISH